VALETSAFIYLLEKIEKGSHVLIASEALIYENSKSPDEQRKVRVASYFNLAREFVGADFSDEERVEPPRAEARRGSTCFVGRNPPKQTPLRLYELRGVPSTHSSTAS
jgi:hypothetical protein